MHHAARILFELQFDGKALFLNQLDLVNRLLADPRTKYHVEKSDIEKYSKAQTRLKTYISQILSATVSRTITEDFKNGLFLIIESRLGNSGNAASVVSDILESIHEKNSSAVKSESKTTLIDQFGSDFNSANYIAVVTSKPLEIDDADHSSLPTLRKYLFSDLIERLFDKEKDLKFYRFNFPIESFGQLFWRLIKRVLFREFKRQFSQDLLESLYQKFAIKTNTIFSASGTDISDEKLEEIVDETLQLLNHNRYILVFTNASPIYGLPMVAMDPSDTKRIKVYALLDSDLQKMGLFKFPDSETLLWRLFVWDTLKSKKFAGQEIIYSAEIA